MYGGGGGGGGPERRGKERAYDMYGQKSYYSV